MKTVRDFSELVGSTPMLECVKFAEREGAGAPLFAKLEAFNPAGSVKDRVALAMIEDAERTGKLKQGAVIVEPTSGNTGIGLAAAAVSRGYRVVLTMPETMSVERRNLLKAYGAEIVLTDGAKGMQGAIERAAALAAELPGAWIPGQFENPANPQAHYETTGPEIWEQMEGRIDCFVSGVGTGGTLTGVGRYLKERNARVRVVAVEPASSPVLSGGQPGKHGIQGIGAGFVPRVMDVESYDEVVTVPDEEAYRAGRSFARSEGVLVGISSGAALSAAVRLSLRPEFAGKRIVALLPDGGDRYLSTPLFSE